MSVVVLLLKWAFPLPMRQLKNREGVDDPLPANDSRAEGRYLTSAKTPLLTW